MQHRHPGAAQVRAAHGHDALGNVAVREVRRHVQVEGVSAEAHPDHAPEGRGQAAQVSIRRNGLRPVLATWRRKKQQHNFNNYGSGDVPPSNARSWALVVFILIWDVPTYRHPARTVSSYIAAQWLEEFPKGY